MPQDAPAENQENLIIKNTFEFENSISNGSNGANLKNGKSALMTPGAKNVLTNRKVLAEKTPNHSKNHIKFLHLYCIYFLQ